MARRIVLRGARALAGEAFAYDPAPLDVVTEGDRIAAIGPAGSAGPADEVIDLAGRLLVPGLVNSHLHAHEHFLSGRPGSRRHPPGAAGAAALLTTGAL